MEDLDLLRKEGTPFKLAGKVFWIEDMPAVKAFKALELYQKANDIIIKKGEVIDLLENSRLAKKYQDAVIDVCIFILRQPFKVSLKWFKNRITKKWLIRNATIKQLERFIKIVLAPILPEDVKKKITEMDGK